MPLTLTPPQQPDSPPAGVAERPYPLPARLDTREAEGLAETLKTRRGGPLIIDASTVEMLGGQCAAVLLAAAKTWSADARGLSVDAPSDAFIRDLGLLGLAIEDISAS